MTSLRNSFPTVAAAIMASFFASSVHAQENNEKTLSDVVVTASGSQVDLKDAPASISVVTREEIERKPFDNVSDLLKTIPGVSGGRGTAGAASKIALRGLPDQYTLILVDGKRVGNSQFVTYRENLARQDLDWITPDMIERIEVVRGPMSSLYGSDAMGGVINIITKKNFSKRSATVSTSLTKPEDSGRGSTEQVSFSAITPIGESLGLRLSGNYLNRESDETVGGEKYQTTSYILGTPGMENSNLNALLNWKLNQDHNIEFEIGQGIQRNKESSATYEGSRGPVPVVDSFGAGKLVRDNYGLTLNSRIWGGQAKFSINQTNYEEKLATSNTFGSSYEELVIDGRFDKPMNFWGLDQAWTFGMQWKEDDLTNPSNIGNQDPATQAAIRAATGSDASEAQLNARTAAIFAENQIFWKENFSTTFGLRLDDSAKFGSHITPRAYAVYHPNENWTVKGGYSEGFRAPSSKESSVGAATGSRGNGCTTLVGMGYPASNGPGCTMIGNPNLKPEETQNYEIGLGFINERLKANATYFHTDFTNKIDYRPLGRFGNKWFTQRMNVDKARTRGLELDASYAVANNLRLGATLTKMFESKNLDTNGPLLAVPDINASLNVSWDFQPGWTSTLTGHYTGKQATVSPDAKSYTYMSGLTTWDLGFSYKMNKTLSFKAGINNLADEQSREGQNQFDAGGREYYIGMTSNF